MYLRRAFGYFEFCLHFIPRRRPYTKENGSVFLYLCFASSFRLLRARRPQVAISSTQKAGQTNRIYTQLIRTAASADGSRKIQRLPTRWVATGGRSFARTTYDAVDGTLAQADGRQWGGSGRWESSFSMSALQKKHSRLFTRWVMMQSLEGRQRGRRVSL